MSVRVCQGCSATYAVGLLACPQCGTDDQENSYDWEEENMKTNAAGVSTLHLEEGQEAVDVPGDVVLVGPGSDEAVDEEVATSVQEEKPAPKKSATSQDSSTAKAASQPTSTAPATRLSPSR